MSSSSSILILLFPLPLILLLIIPVSIGIYVWRDAKRRRMNAVLWTIIAVFAPTLIGFIVYLLVRSNYSDLECPSCGTPVTKGLCRLPEMRRKTADELSAMRLPGRTGLEGLPSTVPLRCRKISAR